MTPELTLMARLIAVAWILTGHVFLSSSRSVPFFSVLAPIAESPIIGWAEVIIGAVCAVQLVFGRAVKASALTLGILIFATTLLSRAYFSNNRLYTACLLILIGLDQPKLLRAQVSILYAAAGLDKLLDADWRSGAFLASFAEELARYGRLWSPGESAGTPYGPAQQLGDVIARAPALFSWATIGCELAIAALLVARRNLGIAFALVFHVALVLYTGSPMGMFLYSGVAALLAFTTVDRRLAIFSIAAFVLLAGPWFRPWLAVILLAALVLGNRRDVRRAES